MSEEAKRIGQKPCKQLVSTMRRNTMNEISTKRILGFIAFGITLYAALMNIADLFAFVSHGIELVTPILLGLVIAFMLNVPMRGFEKILTRTISKLKKPWNEKFIRGLSLALTLASIVLVIIIAFTVLVPELGASVEKIIPQFTEAWPKWVVLLERYHIDLTMMTDFLQKIDIQKISSGANLLLGSAVNIATSTISGIMNTIFALVIAVYILSSKSILASQTKKLILAYTNTKTYDRLVSFGSLVSTTYSKFLSGQCVEAIILGCLIFIAFRLFSLPYAGLIALLTGLFAFVPYVGAFAACFIGAFLTLLEAPSQLILCVGVYLVVQFIENQFIYPVVVGTSVGLSPLWTILAALIGGNLFGLPGIIFFIPLVSVLYQLVRENTYRKLREKNLMQ